MSQISIVIPCHNYGRFLDRVLDSVVAQDAPELEIVVVDDGSTDETAKVVERRRRKQTGIIRYVYQDNAGPGAARNRGARESHGEWLLFLDADDSLLPGALARYRRTLSHNPGASLAVAGAQTVRDGVVVDTRDAGPASDNRIENFAAFVRGELCPFNGGAVLIHRGVMDRLRYPESIYTSEDFVFFAHAFCLFDCASVPAPAVAMHRHSDSLRYNPAALSTARDTMIDLLFDTEILPSEAMRFRNEVESMWCLVVSRALYKHGEYQRATSYYRRAIRLYPRNLLRSGYLVKFVGSTLRSMLKRQ